MPKLNYLNLGCGSHYIKGWINIDLVSHSNFVLQHDLTKGIPLDDDTCAVVYHSHLLEHLSREEANFFLKECFRVLKPRGIIRIAVPDLEQLARQYLQCLQTALVEPSPLSHANYEWSTIELFDQMTREQGGGEMGKYWQKPDIINESTIVDRVGDEFLSFRKIVYNPDDSQTAPAKPLFEKMREFLFSMLKINLKYLKTGRFRHGGEVHKWMYDRYSLQYLLKNIGFHETTVQTAFNSSIPRWEEFIELDVKDGKVRKPDSLFIEGKKP